MSDGWIIIVTALVYGNNYSNTLIVISGTNDILVTV